MKLCIIEIFLFERCTKVRRLALAGLNTVVKLYSNDDLQKNVLNEANFYRNLEVTLANRLRDNLKSRRKNIDSVQCAGSPKTGTRFEETYFETGYARGQGKRES